MNFRRSVISTITECDEDEIVDCATAADDSVFLSPTKVAPTKVLNGTMQNVYPTARSSRTKLSSTFSDIPVCRICHGSEASSVLGLGGKSSGEPLISPCLCAGTMGLYHRPCLERWLAMSNKYKCEICSFQYNTVRKPKGIYQFLESENNISERKNLVGDIICWLVLTPLAIASTYLCLSGAAKTARSCHSGNSVQVPGLISLAVFLMLTYSIWFIVSLRFHYKICMTWREHNQDVYIVDKPHDLSNNSLVEEQIRIGGTTSTPNHTSSGTNLQFIFRQSMYDNPLPETVV